MTINVKGADGSSFAFPDGTAEADITGAMDAHYGSAAAPSVANADPRFSGGGMAGEKFLEGVPVLGGAIPSIGAAISAAAQPLTGVGAPGATFAERHAANLEAEKAASKAADIAQPGLSTALKVGGGIASFGGALKAVPALAGPLGLEGTIPQMVTKGAMSGAGISAADALARGEDPGSAAVEGGVLGAAGGPVGRLIGKTVGAGMRAVRGAPALDHAITTPVAGVDVPVPTSDPAAASQIEIARRGGAGVPAQQVVQQGDQGVQAALEQAKGNIGASIDPNASPAATPQDSAASVAEELRANEANRFQTEQSTMQRATQGTKDLLQSLDTSRPVTPVVPPEAPVAGGAPAMAPLATSEAAPPLAGTAPVAAPTGPTIHAESPLAASEILSAGIQRKAEEAAAARTAAYAAKAAIPGEYSRQALKSSGDAIRSDLSSGPIENRVRVTSSTPKATEALQLIDETIGGSPPQALPNAAVPKSQMTLEPITGDTMEGVRKGLNQIYGDALRSANGPGGNPSDARAVGRIIDAFDTHISNVEDAGGFSGDAKALSDARNTARASHVAYKTTFEPRNPGDKAGSSIEKIVGKFDGQEAGPDQVTQMAYGSAGEPGGTPAAQFAQRIKSIFGENSKEWAAYKQGLASHLMNDATGKPLSPADAADRIDQFLKAPKGKILGQMALTAEDRAALANHAETLRATQPVALKDLGTVDKLIGRITGRDGGPPASINEVTDYLFGPSSGKKGLQFQLATRLKRDLSPEGFNALRTGMWSKMTGVTEGKTDLTPKRLSDNLFEFLNGSGSDLSKVLYSPAERTEMLRLAQAVKMHVPIAGTTNPSGTAPMLSKIARGASHLFLPTVGLVHGGIPGAIVGAAADKAIGSVSAARAARKAGLLYYGPQRSVATDPRFAKAAGILTRGAAQGQVGGP